MPFSFFPPSSRSLVFAQVVATFCLSLSLSCVATAAPASKAHPTVKATAAAPSNSPAPVDKRTTDIMTRLKLEDPKAASAAQEALANFFADLSMWHKQNDATLKAPWEAFNKAYPAHDKAQADAAVRQIDLTYATFQAQHDALLTKLRAVLSVNQVEAVEDLMTGNKVKVTFKSYRKILPELTADQSAFVLQNLKLAREEAINGASGTEKSAFFKKYKMKIEAYLIAQGYDVNKAYDSFLAKEQADIDAKNAPPPPKGKKN